MRRPSIKLNEEAVVTFISEMQKSLVQLRAAVTRSDLVTLRRVAHYLHGAAAFIDAPAMIQICAALEYTAVSADMQRADEALTALEIEAAWLWVELNDTACEGPIEAA
jgi:HPt (histidine-containing phosphotransfer) domain-containing protein